MIGAGSGGFPAPTRDIPGRQEGGGPGGYVCVMSTPTSRSVASRTAPDLDSVRRRLVAIDQSHVLNFYDGLDEGGRRSLLAQIASLPLERLPRLIDEYVRSKPSLDVDPGALEPAPYYPNDPNSPVRAWDREKYRRAGEDLIAGGRVAAFTVAGGQGSRLGYEGPKGMFPGGAVSGKPLFRMLAEWVLATERRYGVTVPWYVMTSPINHEETVAFFEEHDHFGRSAEDTMFFPQGVMPSLDLRTGRLLLADRGTVATNPDGHGGSLRALYTSGAIDDMRRRGIEQISYFQVDNPIVRAIDPVFIGLHASAEDSSAEMCAKVVLKTDPAEKVGVICRTARGIEVVEYSDLPDELARQRDESGALRFRLGSIAIHVIGVEFVARLNGGAEGFSLPFHRAEKKVPCIDPETGEAIDPEAPNAVKLETFVFDALPFASSPIVYETDRIDEFAPIKNAEGSDSPATCARIQTERAARWLESRGVRVPRSKDGAPACELELSPLTELDREAALPATVERGARMVL